MQLYPHQETSRQFLLDAKRAILADQPRVGKTLPTAAAGLHYTFIVGTTFTGAGQINTDNTSDLFSGFATIFDPATATDNNTFIPDASNDDTIDLGSAAQGWLVGGVIRLVATSAAVWHCEAFLHGDGTLATPFE